MSAPRPAISPATSSQAAVPVVVFCDGGNRRTLTLGHVPFTIGRRSDRDLVIADARVSREHAAIIAENGDYFVLDQGSRRGTFVNGERIERHKLRPNDRIEFGVLDGPYLAFKPSEQPVSRQFMTDIAAWTETSGASDLEKLTLFLEAARKLNATTVLEDVLVTLLDATLRLTHTERGYVFLYDAAAQLRLAVGRDAAGHALSDDSTISHSILHDAANSAIEFLVSDTSLDPEIAGRNSIMAYDLRSVICIPLRKGHRQQPTPGASLPSDVMGLLYLDSRQARGEVTAVSNDILHAIATEAAALVENARLVEVEEAARKYRQELAIAAAIQQRLIAVTIPDVPYATVRARSLSCREIGGDFYDAVRTEAGLAFVVADVCGKGVSAALLASTLQGIMWPSLVAGMPLAQIVATAHQFLQQKNVGEQYATVLLALLRSDGELEYVNCGHVPPVLLTDRHVVRPAEGNLPLGLLAGTEFASARVRLRSGDRFIVVTDGVTEARDHEGNWFGDERLHRCVMAESAAVEEVFRSVAEFCGDEALQDDLTVLEVLYRG